VSQRNAETGFLVPGWTAYRITRVATVLAAIAVGSGILLIVLGTLLKFPPGSLGYNLFVALALFAVLPFFAVFWAIGSKAERRQKAEVAAGYTTLRGRYQQIEQLNPMTGRVIRRAGEPLLSSAEFRRHIRDNSNGT
jgi:uncharacterized membrane protein YedE/YeeE